MFIAEAAERVEDHYQKSLTRFAINNYFIIYRFQH